MQPCVHCSNTSARLWPKRIKFVKIRADFSYGITFVHRELLSQLSSLWLTVDLLVEESTRGYQTTFCLS